MQPEAVSIPISDSIGIVSGEIIRGDNPTCVFVFAHGAGAGMNHPFMERLATLLGESGVATLRFNFPYIEKGRKRPDPPAVAVKACARAVAVAHDRFPDLPLFAGGKSFGGRMTSHAAASEDGLPVKGMILVGFPLHPAGQPGIARASHLAPLPLPMLFLQGTRDALADTELMESICRDIPMSTLMKFEGADHSFKAGKRDLLPSLAEAIRSWTEAVILTPS